MEELNDLEMSLFVQSIVGDMGVIDTLIDISMVGFKLICYWFELNTLNAKELIVLLCKWHNTIYD